MSFLKLALFGDITPRNPDADPMQGSSYTVDQLILSFLQNISVDAIREISKFFAVLFSFYALANSEAALYLAIEGKLPAAIMILFADNSGAIWIFMFAWCGLALISSIVGGALFIPQFRYNLTSIGFVANTFDLAVICTKLFCLYLMADHFGWMATGLFVAYFYLIAALVWIVLYLAFTALKTVWLNLIPPMAA